MKKFTTIKTLLVGLCAMGATSVWADDYYNIVRYSQDYEDATTYETGWVFGGGDHSQGSNGANHYLQMSLNKNKATVTHTLSFASNSFIANSTDFCFSFDFGYGSGNAYQKPTSLTLKDKDGNTIFMFKNSADEGWGNDFVLTDGGNNTLGTYTATYKTLSNPLLNISVIGNNSDGLKLTVNNNGTKIADGVKVADFAAIGSLEIVVTGGASIYAFDNMVFAEHSDSEQITDPAIKLTGVDGQNRIVTITNGVSSTGKTVSTYYTTDGSDPTSSSSLYSKPITIEDDCTVKAISISSSNVESGISSFDVTTGEITLNTPVWVKSAYDSSTQTSTVTLSSNQTNLLLQPEAAIYYSLDGGEAALYSTPISVIDGQVLTYYATANGYTNSAEGSVTAVAPCSYPVIISESYASGSDMGISVNADEIVTTINTTNFFYMLCNNEHLSENLITSSTALSNWLLRTGGLYAGNTGNYAIKGVRENDIITITFGPGTESPVPTSPDGIKDEWNSTSNSIVFKVTATHGNFRFNYGRYGYIKSIIVQRESETVNISEAGYATLYVNAPIEFPEELGVTAYVASVKENVVTFTQVNKVPANTGVLLKANPGKYSIPVVLDGGEATSELIGGTKIAPVGSFVLMKNGDQVGFYKTKEEFTLSANTAYIAPLTESAREFIAINGEATAIKAVETKQQNGEIYNLAGQRVNKAQKGLYIQNGKKVIIK